MRPSRPLLVLVALGCAACSAFGGSTEPAGPPPVTAAPQPEAAPTDAPAAVTEVDPVQERLDALRARLDTPLPAADRVAVADGFGEGRLQLRGDVSVDVGAGVPWGGWAPDTSTSQLRLLHSLLIVHDLVATERPEDLEAAGRLLRDWVGANPRGDAAHHMAWHDETTARRTTALVRLHDALTERGLDDESLLQLVHDQLVLHLEALLEDDFHATGTNHGMFQDRAALVASAYLDVRDGPSDLTDRGWDVARQRLLDYFRVAITGDGVHYEHAPAYHQTIAMAARSEAGLLAALGDQAGADELTAIFASMVRYATHVVQPDGTWPLVSDTFPRNRPSPTMWDDAAYRYAATAGQDGQVPAERAVAFPEAGYVIMRDRWGDDGRGTYLHLTAAYHTDYHKHADDLSLWLYHDGPLLTELGPQGYTMSDPLVRCAYSDDAHNLATVDGLDLPRTDGRTEATRLTGHDLDGPVWTATGVNGRVDGVRYEREVAFDPDAGTVEVTDRVRSDADRAVRVRWHLDPSVTATADGAGVTLAREGLADVHGTFTAAGGVSVDVLGPDPDLCAGLRFGGDEPVETSTVEVRTRPGTVTEVVSRFELP